MSDQQINPKTAEFAKQLAAKDKASRPWIKWAITSVALVLVTCSTVWAIRSYSKNKVIASLQSDPRKIRDAVETGKITRDDAQNLWEQQQQKREAEQDKRMDEYFALPEGKQRTAFLDKVIDEMEARRKEWEKRASTRPARERSTTRPTTGPTTRPEWGNRGGAGGGDQVARMRSRIESGDPARKAQRAAMMDAMRQRMAERGIKTGGPGGGFGGGRGGGGGGGRGGASRFAASGPRSQNDARTAS